MTGDSGNEQKCFKCQKEIREEFYQCDICTEKIHLDCAKLSASEVKCMPLQKRLLIYCCEKCRDIIKNIPKMLMMLEDIQQKVSKIEIANRQCPILPVKPYNEVAKTKIEAEEVILIKPKNKNQNSLSTKKAIEDQINPSSIGAEVSRVKFVRDGGVAISCTKKEDVLMISENVKKSMNQEYEVKIPEKKTQGLKLLISKQKWLRIMIC